MKTSNPSVSPEKFAAHLRKLSRDRMNDKKRLREQVIRKSPSAALRLDILSKTAGVCHICGGEIEGSWHADHVSHHSKGGPHDVANYLPAHQACNSSRKGFDPEEMKWILKLGVWLKTQIEKETKVGQPAAEAFCKYESKRAARRVK